MSDYIISINKELAGEIKPIPSKSTIHRSLICALLVRGKTKITNIIDSIDVLTTLQILKDCGVKVQEINDGYIIDSTNINCPKQIKVNESGSTLRFIVPVMLYLFGETNIDAQNGLKKRPQDLFKDIFEQSDIKNYNLNFPLQAKGEIKARDYKLIGNISSQFISGLLFVLPLLDKDSTISFTTAIESRGYIDLTIDVLAQFGIKITWKNDELIIKGRQKYQNGIHYQNEIDASNLPYFQVLAKKYPKVKIVMQKQQTKQPDSQFIDLISNGENKQISVAQCPDLLPILACYYAFEKKEIEIVDTKRTKIKESNRLETITSELNKIGCNLKILPNGNLLIKPCDTYKYAICSGQNDHRIVMSLAIASCISKQEIRINNPGAVNKSDPYFFDKLKYLGVNIKEVND